MAKRKTRTKEEALSDLSGLRRNIFTYLHIDYRIALDMAMKALERELEQESEKAEKLPSLGPDRGPETPDEIEAMHNLQKGEK